MYIFLLFLVLILCGSLTIIPVSKHAAVRGGVATHNRLCFDYVARLFVF